jgi:hypothetical protein
VSIFCLFNLSHDEVLLQNIISFDRTVVLHFILSHSGVGQDGVSEPSKKDSNHQDSISHNDDNAGSGEMTSTSTRPSSTKESVSDPTGRSPQDDYGIADSGAVCVDKKAGPVTDMDMDIDDDAGSDWSVGNGDQDQQGEEGHDIIVGRMVDSIRDGSLVNKMNLPCKTGFKESFEGDLKDVNIKVAIPLPRFKHVLRPEEVRFDEYCTHQRQKISMANNMGSDSILLRNEFEVPISPLLCSLSMSPPYSPNREKGYLVPEAVTTPNRLRSGISIENLHTTPDKKTGKYVKNNGTSGSIEFSSIDVDKFHRDFEEKYRRQTESLVSNRDVDGSEYDCDNDENSSGMGSDSSFPVCVGLLKATSAFPNDKEMWGELCYIDDGTAALKLYRVLHKEESDNSTEDSNKNSSTLTGFKINPISPSLTLAASYSITRCRPLTAAPSRGRRIGSIELMDGNSYDNQEDLIVGDRKGGIASILKGGRVTDENSILLNQSESVPGGFSVKMRDSPTVAACDDDSEIDKRNSPRLDFHCSPPPYGFEILLPMTAARDRNVSFDLSGTRNKPEPRVPSEKGVMKGAQRAIGTVTWASEGNIAEREKEISKNVEKEKWLSFLCCSESESAGWISSLQMASKV